MTSATSVNAIMAMISHDEPLQSMSRPQRQPCPWLRWSVASTAVISIALQQSTAAADIRRAQFHMALYAAVGVRWPRMSKPCDAGMVPTRNPPTRALGDLGVGTCSRSMPFRAAWVGACRTWCTTSDPGLDNRRTFYDDAGVGIGVGVGSVTPGCNGTAHLSPLPSGTLLVKTQELLKALTPAIANITIPNMRDARSTVGLPTPECFDT